ncbi:hypothetical protein SAMN02745687_02173 [Lachnospiraceae bacterium NK3A20]|nr:hypothetical protein SAMN02745687_02173 [Lachnospiraceae bacterium NK3A20]
MRIQGVSYNVTDKYQLYIDREGISYVSANGKKSLNIKFADVGSIVPLRYCSSNQSYSILFRDYNGKNMKEEIETDVQYGNGYNNIQETKSILIAFAESKLTSAFPDNIDFLDIQLAFNIKEKEIRLKDGTIIGAVHQVKLTDIRRVKCVGNGTLNSLLIYKKDKGGFLDAPDMRIPVNELTLPVLEMAMVRNTGRGIDFSQGNGFDQKTSEYIVARYMNSTFFVNEDGSITDDWHRIAYEHVHSCQSDIEISV